MGVKGYRIDEDRIDEDKLKGHLIDIVGDKKEVEKHNISYILRDVKNYQVLPW
ncbi:hypothetical protein HUT03_04670 [Candidatus Liberibacter africanus]|uniref:hypothetical protein n=1 Tax=Liberibacter africanus TaxID=34020 RepID=UPI000A88ACA7|nr:hypothetical protein [Candidatus Liberibacter africanus]QTP64239.1 hypothetical protein HUT03_04670 [Candidatus Liberibacter africanus]